MRWLVTTLAAGVVLLTIGRTTHRSSRQAPERDSAIEPPAADITPHDCYLSWRPNSDILLWVVRQQLGELPNRRVLPLPQLGGVEYMRWNRKRTRLVMGDKETAVVASYPELSDLKVLAGATTSAWWDAAGHVNRIVSDERSRYFLLSSTRRIAIPPPYIVTATSADGSAWLAHVVDKRRPFDRAGNIRLGFRSGTGRLVWTGKLLKDQTIIDLPYGDFVVNSAHSRWLMFGVGGSTDRDKSRSAPYLYHSGDERARQLWPPDWARELFSVTLSEPVCGGGTFVGIRHTEPLNLGEGSKRESYAEYEVRAGRAQYHPIRGDLLAFSMSEDGKRRAYLVRENGRLQIVALKAGRLCFVSAL